MLFIESKLWQVYLTKMLCTRSRVLSEDSISARGYDPLLLARAFNLHAKTETMTVLLHAFRCIFVLLIRSSFGWFCGRLRRWVACSLQFFCHAFVGRLTSSIRKDGIRNERGPVGLGNTAFEGLDFLDPAVIFIKTWFNKIRERGVNHEIHKNIMPQKFGAIRYALNSYMHLLASLYGMYIERLLHMVVAGLSLVK